MGEAGEDENSGDDFAPRWEDLIDGRAAFYVEPADRRRYRRLLLDAIEQSFPEILADLQRRTLEVSQVARTRPGVLERIIEHWGVTHQLHDAESKVGDWIMAAARRAVMHWAEHPEEAPGPATAGSWGPDGPTDELVEQTFIHALNPSQMTELNEKLRAPLLFKGAPWDPGKMLRGEYLDAVTADFRAHVSVYQEALESYFGWRPIAPAGRKFAEHHFRWLVESRLEGLTFKEIAARHLEVRRDEVSEDSIKKAVHETAKLLFGGLWRVWLRPRRPGRRPHR